MAVVCGRCGAEFDPPALGVGETRLAGDTPPMELPCPRCGELLVLDSLMPTVIVSPQVDRTGTTISHFILVRQLGAGTFGEVWLANDLTLGRQVAIKLPKLAALDSMPLNEARTAASLRHDNIVRVLEVGLDGNQVFIASEYVEGMTLRDFLSTGKPSVDRVLDLLITVSDALDFAHRAGVIHRDIKPGNILLDKSGRPYIADFGIAKRINADSTISHEGQVIGTARYMSPEQAGGKSKEADSRSDIYSIGVMLFEMLTGDVPFRGNVQAMLHLKTVEDPPSPRRFNPAVSRDLETVCLKCLEREPARRYAAARDVAEELRRIQSGDPIQARPISQIERVWRWCRQRPVVASLLASLFLSLTLGMSGVTYFWRRAVERGNAAEASLYRSLMNLGSAHLENGDYPGVKQLLAHVEADPEMRHLRGFEWDYFRAATTPLTLVTHHGDAVRDVALARDGSLCASSGFDGSIQVRNPDSGELVRRLAVGDVEFRSLDFSPTTLHLASGGRDGYVRVWEPGQHDRALWQVEHGSPVVLVRYSPRGDRLLSVGQKGPVRVWETVSGQKLWELPTGRFGPAGDVRFAPDGKTLYVTYPGGHVRVWDLPDQGDPRPTGDFELLERLRGIALSDDGRTLVGGTWHGQLVIRDLEGRSTEIHQSIWGRIDDLDFVKGTRLLAIVSSDGQTHLFDLDERHDTRTFSTHGLGEASLGRSADGTAVVIGSGDGSVTKVGAADLKQRRILRAEEQRVHDLAVLEDGRGLLAIDESGSVRHWNLEDGSDAEITRDKTYRRMAVSPDRELLALSGTGPNVTLLNRLKKEIVHQVPSGPTGAVTAQFSRDGQRLAIATRSGRVRMLRVGRWTEAVFETDAVADLIRALEFSSDGKTLAVARSGGSVELLDSATGKAQAPPIKLRSEPLALEFCEGDRLLAIGTAVGELHLWQIEARRPRVVINAHTGRINALETLPDGRTLVSAGRDRNLLLWDLPTAELITPLAGHTRQIFALAQSPDGKTLYSGGIDGEIRVWKSRSESD